MTIFSECGRPWPCKCKHEIFDKEKYHEKFKKKMPKFSGYSKQREDDGQFAGIEGR